MSRVKFNNIFFMLLYFKSLFFINVLLVSLMINLDLC